MCIYSIRKDTNKLSIDWFNDSENQPPEDVWIERIAIHLEGVHTRYFHDQKAMWHKHYNDCWIDVVFEIWLQES